MNSADTDRSGDNREAQKAPSSSLHALVRFLAWGFIIACRILFGIAVARFIWVVAVGILRAAELAAKYWPTIASVLLVCALYGGFCYGTYRLYELCRRVVGAGKEPNAMELSDRLGGSKRGSGEADTSAEPVRSGDGFGDSGARPNAGGQTL